MLPNPFFTPNLDIVEKRRVGFSQKTRRVIDLRTRLIPYLEP
jgi:hypothetical protein